MQSGDAGSGRTQDSHAQAGVAANLPAPGPGWGHPGKSRTRHPGNTPPARCSGPAFGWLQFILAGCSAASCGRIGAVGPRRHSAKPSKPLPRPNEPAPGPVRPREGGVHRPRSPAPGTGDFRSRPLEGTGPVLSRARRVSANPTGKPPPTAAARAKTKSTPSWTPAPEAGGSPAGSPGRGPARSWAGPARSRPRCSSPRARAGAGRAR